MMNKEARPSELFMGPGEASQCVDVEIAGLREIVGL